jgi:hypothetical protein
MLELITFLTGEAKYAFLVHFGAVTFFIAFISAILITLYNGLWMTHYMRKHHPQISKIPNGTFKKGSEYGRAIKSLNDPVLRSVSKRRDNYAKLCLLVWLILFLIVGGVVLILHLLGI